MRRRHRAVWIIKSGAVAILALMFNQGVRAEDPPHPTYRRVFVPHQALADRIEGLIPLRREEFERRIGVPVVKPAETRQPTDVVIEQVVFSARLVAGRLESGVAKLDVVCPSGREALLFLDPCNLICSSAHWLGGNEPAILGVDARGRLQCVVRQSGTLELAWSLPAQEPAADESLTLPPFPKQYSFRLSLPPATRRQLHISTPPDLKLELAGGIAEQPQQLANSSDQLWKFELAAQRDVELVARSTVEPVVQHRSLLARENAVYSLTSATLDLDSKWVVDITDSAVEELQLQIESPLHITNILVNDRAVAFESVRASDANDPVLAVARLPAPLQVGRHHLQILATAHSNLSKPAPLPRIQLVDSLLQDALWEVTAPDWLELTARPQGDCLQVQSSSATGRNADRFVFHALTSEGSIEVVSRPTPRPLSERSSTQITVEGNQVLGVVVAELAGNGREIFAIDADIPRQWIIDSVEAVPAAMLGDRTLTARGQASQHLNIQLAQPIVAGRPLKLILRGHHRRPANGELRGRSSFELARFPAAAPARRLLSIRTNDPGVEMRLRGDDDLVRFRAEDLPPADREFIESTSTTPLFDAETVRERLIARFQPAAASYRGDVLIKAHIDSGDLQQTAVIKCQPEATAVGSIVVRMVPPATGSVRWLLAGDEPRELTAAIETDSSTKDSALYRLSLPRPASAPFEIHGQWTADQNSPVSLLWLPDANRQATLVEVYSAEGIPELSTEGLRSLPLPDVRSQAVPCVARYCYETGQPATLKIHRRAHVGSLPQVRVDSMRISSQLTLGGRFEHDVSIQVNDSIANTLPLRLPEEVTDLRLMDQGQERALQRSATGEFQIPLGVSRGPLELRLRYSLPARESGFWPFHKVSAPIPSLLAPGMSQTWSLVLPPGFAPLAQPHAAQRFVATARPGAVLASSSGASLEREPMQDALRAARALLGGLNLAVKTGWFSPAEGTPATDVSFRGWQVYDRELLPGQKAEVTIYRVPALLVWSLILVLLLPPLGQWLVRLPTWLALVAGTLLAIAMVIAPPGNWLVLGALGGLILGAAWQWCTNRRSGSTSRLPLPSASAVAAATILFAAVFVCQREANSAPPENASGSFRVIYPTNEVGQPHGDYVYLDRALYDEIHRAPPPADTKVPAWLLRTAQYEIRGSLPLKVDRAGPVELGITLDVYVLEELAELVLGFRRDEILLLSNSTTLDDEPISLAWHESGLGLIVPAMKKGSHQLKLQAAARCEISAGKMHLRAAIPPAAVTTVLAPRSAIATGLQVTGSIRDAVSNPSAVAFSVPHTRDLSLHWPAAEAAATAAASTEVEKLLLWKIRPGSIVLEGLFKFRSVAEPVKELRLRPHPALRLLPSLAPATAESVSTSEEAGGMVLVQLAEPKREGQFRLNWLWPESSSTGTLVLPQIEVPGASLARDWLAIVAQSGLTLKELTGVDRSLDVAEFQRAAGVDLPPFAAAAAIASRNGARAEVFIRPSTAVPIATDKLDWSISRTGAALSANYQLTNVSRTCFEHRLSLPKGFKLSLVKILQAGREAPVRHWLSPSGQLSISLLEAPLAEHTILIQGELPLPLATTELRLPSPQLLDVEVTQSELRLFRQLDVDLSVKSASPWLTRNEPAAGELSPRLGRLAAHWISTSPAAPAELLVARRTNQARLTGRAILQVAYADGDWQGTLDLNLNIQNGLLDRVRLLLDQDWSEAVSINPSWAHEWEPGTGDGRQLLTLIPPAGLTGQVHVRLTAPLSAESGGIEAPSLRLLDAEKIEQFVLLDRGSDAAPIDWETTGLVVLENAPPEMDTVPPSLVLHRVLAESYRALARLRPATKSATEISLATLNARLQNSHVVIAAAYDVILAGSDDLVFELPPDSRLLQVLVDSQPSLVRQTGLRSWRIARRSELLPQSLTIEYESTLPQNTGVRAVRLGSPQFVGVAPRISLWSLDDSFADRASAPARFPGERNQAAMRECSAAEAALLQLESCARALEAVQASRGSYVPASIVSEAYHRWQAELDRADAQLRALELPVDRDRELNAMRQAALTIAADARQRLVQAGILSEEDATATLQPTQLADAPQLRWFQSSTSLELPVALSPSPTPVFSRRPLLAALILLGSLILPMAARRMRRHYNSATVAPAALALLGVTWWALAPAGWLGWAFLGVAGWLAIARSPLSFQASSGSTIQRLSALR